MLYFAVTGHVPMDSPTRIGALLDGTDPMIPAREAARANYSASFLNAIDGALQLKSWKRPQSIAAWRSQFDDFESEVFTEAETVVDEPPASPGSQLTDSYG